jgi:hypothetical protein
MTTSVRRLYLFLGAWGAAAALAGALHLLRLLPPSAAPIVIASACIAFSIAAVSVGWMRDAIARIGVRGLLAAHVVRFIGLYFLWLYSQGRMPREFAFGAGVGDVIAAGGAIALFFWRDGPAFRRALFAWNVFGIADLLLAVGTAGWLNVTRPGSMIEMSSLPLAIVPLWLVPALIASHVVVFRGFARARRATNGERWLIST